jgi:hypothetical protein
MRPSTRVKMQTNPGSSPNGNHGVNCFEHKPGTVLDRSTIFVGAMITHILEKLVEQVAIGPVELDSIKASRECIFGSSPVLGHNSGNFIELKGARSHKRLFRANQAHVSIRSDGARGNGKSAIQINRVRDTTDMPQLQKDSPSRLVDGFGHTFPARDLFFRPDARSIRISDAHWRDGSRFGNNQAGAGALPVIFPHQIIGNATFAGAAAGQWSHDYAVGEVPSTDPDWVLQCGHSFGFAINRLTGSIVIELSGQPILSQSVV